MYVCHVYIVTVGAILLDCHTDFLLSYTTLQHVPILIDTADYHSYFTGRYHCPPAYRWCTTLVLAPYMDLWTLVEGHSLRFTNCKQLTEALDS